MTATPLWKFLAVQAAGLEVEMVNRYLRFVVVGLFALCALFAQAQRPSVIWSTYSDEAPGMDAGQAVSADGRYMAVPEHSLGLVKIIDLTTGTLRSTLSTATASSTSMALSPGGRYLTVFDRGGGAPDSRNTGIYDVETGRRVADFDLGENATPTWTPSGRSLLLHRGGSVALLDFNPISRTLTQRWEANSTLNSPLILGSAISHDESVVAVLVKRTSGAVDYRIECFDAGSGAAIGQLGLSDFGAHELERIVASTISPRFYVTAIIGNARTLFELNTVPVVLRSTTLGVAFDYAADWTVFQDRFTLYAPTYAPGLVLRDLTRQSPIFIRASDLGVGARPTMFPPAGAAYAFPDGLAGKGNSDLIDNVFQILGRALTFIWHRAGNAYTANEALTDQIGAVTALDELPNGDLLSMSWLRRDGNNPNRIPTPGVVVRSRVTGKVTRHYRPWGTDLDTVFWSGSGTFNNRALRLVARLAGTEERVLAFVTGLSDTSTSLDFPGRAVAFRMADSSVLYKVEDIRSLGLSPDRTRMAVGTRDGRVVLRNALTGAEIAGTTTVGLHRDVRFSPDGTVVFALTDERLYRLSATNLAVLAEVPITGAFSQRNTRLHVSRDGAQVFVYDVFRGADQPLNLVGAELWVYSAATLAELAATDFDQSISGLEPTREGYLLVGFSPGRITGWPRHPGRTRIIDPSNAFEAVRTYDLETGWGPTAFLESADGERLYIGRDDDVLLATDSPLDDRRLALTTVSPGSVTKVPHAWLTLDGNGFRDDTQVRLVRGGTTLSPQTFRRLDRWVVEAEFDLSAAELGAWDVRATNPDGQTVTLPESLTVVSTGVAEPVAFRIVGQTSVRPNRMVAFYVEYANQGSVPLPAPFFTVHFSIRHGHFKLDRDDPWTQSRLALLGIGQHEGDILYPGERRRVPLYYIASSTHCEITLTRVDALDASYFANNWADGQPEHPPATGQEWDDVWGRFIARFGNTAATYLAELRRTARYLGRLGEPVHDVRDLVDLAMSRAIGSGAALSTLESSVDAAVPTPGLSLALTRSAPSDYLGRRRMGPFGRGWKTPWEVRVAPYSGPTYFVTPYPFHRVFSNRLDPGVEGWKGEDGDRGKLEFLPDGRAKISEIDGRVTVYRTDRALDYVEDLNGNRITVGYDAGGKLTSLNHSNGASIALIYNGNGHVSAATDNLGRTTTYIYTGLQLTSVTYPGGRTVAYEYAPNGDLTKVVYPDGTERRFTYNGQLVLSSVSMTMGMMPVAFAYPLGSDADPTPGRTTATSAQSRVWTVDRNAMGQVSVAQDPLGNVTRIQHDVNGNVRRVVNAKGDAWTIESDKKGNPIGSTDPLGGTLRLGFTPELNRLDWIRDRKNVLTDYESDPKGNLTRITYPDNTFEAWSYDVVGNPILYRNRRGQTIGYQYNIAGQVTNVVRSDGRTYFYAYDARGRMTTASDSVTGAIAMTYDARDFLTRVDFPGGRWFEYLYDNAGKRTKRTGHDGQIENYLYDAMGHLWKLTDGTNSVLVEYLYDSVGRLSRENKGNGTYTVYGYDGADRLTSLQHFAPNGTLQTEERYDYDSVGNPIRQRTPGGNYDYGYDKLGQLTSVKYPDASITTTTYDAEGNRVSVSDGATTGYTTNALNQYTQVGSAAYQYDADGNLVSKTLAGVTTTYDYDQEGNLVGMGSPGDVWTFEYDALGNRVRTTHNGAESRYLYDGLNLAAEYDGVGALQARYAHGIGLVARSDATGVGFYAFDLTGNTRLITGLAGAVLNAYDYKPFGGLLSSSETMTNPFGFAGRLGVRRVGALHDMRARFYDSGLGRFARPDPIGIAGGGANLYGYVGNKPTALVDPIGLSGPGSTYTRDDRGESPFDTHGRYGSYKQEYGTARAIAGHLSYGRGGMNGLLRAGGKNWWRGVSKVTPVGVVLDLVTPSDLGPGMEFDPGYGMTDGITGMPIYFRPPVYEPGDELRFLPPGNPGGTGPIDRKGPPISVAVDPNEKRGPEGVTERRFVPSSGEFQYDVLFENIGNAHLQELLIEDQLDANLDWSTFKLGDIRFGNQVVSEFGGLQRGYFRVPLLAPANPESPTNPENTHLVVDVWVTFDEASGKIRWLLKAIDPLTEEFPTGIYEGFLPPNTYVQGGQTLTHEDGRGEGKMTFSIYPRPGLTEGTEIANRAKIVFEPSGGGSTIVTNEWINTLDERAPESQVLTLPLFSFDPSILVRWVGTDGTGIASYDVWVSENGGAYAKWKDATTETFGTYPGVTGRSYRFYSVATDLAGNVEAAPAIPDAQTSLGNRVSGTATLADFAGVRTGTPVEIRLLEAGTNTVLETVQTFLDQDGRFEFGTGRTGTFDLTVKTPTHLRVKLTGVELTSSGASGLTANLTDNGDADGSNTINVADFLRVRAAFGSSPSSPNWNPRADSNGNGSVNVQDFLILRKNFGRSGA